MKTQTKRQNWKYCRDVFMEFKRKMSKPLTVKEILEYVPFNADTIMRYCRQKRIPHYRIGRSLFFDKNKVILWLESKHQNVIKERGRKAEFDPDKEVFT